MELDDGVPFMTPGELDPIEDAGELLEARDEVVLVSLHAAESVVVLLVAEDVVEGSGPAAFAELPVEVLESGLSGVKKKRVSA